MVVGRYFPGNSFVHRLDPRVKLATGFAFILILVLTNHWLAYGGLILFTAIMMKISGVPFRIFIKGVRPLMVIIVFTALLQLFFSGGGQVFFRWGPLRVTEGGIAQAVTVFLRFTMTIFMSIVVSITTRPIEFTDAVESLLSPLRHVKVPVQDLALMLSIALRFIPTLMEESQRIMKAQQSRGVEFGEGNIYQQMKALIPVFLPLFVSSFYRAEEMANALDVRGYQGDRKRTKLRIRKWKVGDTCYLIAFLFLSLFVLRVEFFRLF